MAKPIRRKVVLLGEHYISRPKIRVSFRQICPRCGRVKKRVIIICSNPIPKQKQG